MVTIAGQCGAAEGTGGWRVGNRRFELDPQKDAQQAQQQAQEKKCAVFGMRISFLLLRLVLVCLQEVEDADPS